MNKRGGKEKKTKVDDYDKTGHCAIHYAAERGHVDAAEYLVKQVCHFTVVVYEFYVTTSSHDVYTRAAMSTCGESMVKQP